MCEIKLPQMKTIKEIAEIAHLPQYFIRQLVLSGKIPYVMAGRKYLINLDKFINFLNMGEYVEKPETDKNLEKMRIEK